MLHHKRHWFISSVDTANALAAKLTKTVWTLCSGFAVQGFDEYLFVNDATSPDGAQEYAVLHKEDGGSYRQIETITFGWCSADRAEILIDEMLAGSFDHCNYGTVDRKRIQQGPMTKSHHCVHCA